MKILILACAISVAAGFFGGYKWQQGALDELALKHANDKIKANDQDVVVNNVHANNVRVAQGKAADRASASVMVVDRNRSELERLRNELAAASEASAANLNACTAHVATQRELFDQCATALVDLAEKTDRWAGHAALMQDTIRSAEQAGSANPQSPQPVSDD